MASHVEHPVPRCHVRGEQHDRHRAEYLPMGLAHFLNDDALIRGWREGSDLFGRPCLDAVARRGGDCFGGSIIVAVGSRWGRPTDDLLGPGRGRAVRGTGDGSMPPVLELWLR